MDLHSIMLLLYPIHGLPEFSFEDNKQSMMRLNMRHTCVNFPPIHPIYIPLCFYFICGNNLCSFIPFWIYIPLCFYFIYIIITERKYTHPHLHSIMLLLYPCYLPGVPGQLLHLHSIMLLLYLLAMTLKRSKPSIYIPLCFYFIIY